MSVCVHAQGRPTRGSSVHVLLGDTESGSHACVHLAAGLERVDRVMSIGLFVMHTCNVSVSRSSQPLPGLAVPLTLQVQVRHSCTVRYTIMADTHISCVCVSLRVCVCVGLSAVWLDAGWLQHHSILTLTPDNNGTQARCHSPEYPPGRKARCERLTLLEFWPCGDKDGSL
jgi:hypothetical protein